MLPSTFFGPLVTINIVYTNIKKDDLLTKKVAPKIAWVVATAPLGATALAYEVKQG